MTEELKASHEAICIASDKIQSLTARVAQLEKELSNAVEQWKLYVQLHEAAEAACNQNIKRIAELEMRPRSANKELLDQHAKDTVQISQLMRRVAELEAALKAVIAIADRETNEFIHARAVLHVEQS